MNLVNVRRVAAGLFAVSAAWSVFGSDVSHAQTVGGGTPAPAEGSCPAMADAYGYVGQWGAEGSTVEEAALNSLSACNEDFANEILAQGQEQKSNKKLCGTKKNCKFTGGDIVEDEPCSIDRCLKYTGGQQCQYFDGVGGNDLNAVPPILVSGTCSPSGFDDSDWMCATEGAFDRGNYECYKEER